MKFSDLAKMASGHVEARIVQAAVALGVFDALNGKALSSGAVASNLSTDPRATELLLNALTALGLLDKSQDRYSLTAVSKAHLLRNAPQSYNGMIEFDAALWECWGNLAAAVRSGQPMRAANMYQDDSRETERFIRAMDSLINARGDAAILENLFDWSNTAAMLDVGSGPGTYPIHLCRRYPELRITIFDLPGTLKVTERYIREAGMQNRFRLVAGDYRTDPIPGCYPVIFVSNIIHGESFEENEKLMGKLAAHLEPGGKIIIKDHILDNSRTHPAVGAVFSMLMLLTTRQGRCFSFDEVKEWLEKAGLIDIAQIGLPAPLTSTLVVAFRPSNR